LLAGILLIVVAGLLSPEEFMRVLRGEPGPFSSGLLLGAQLFRISLVGLGVVCVLLPKLPVWQTETRAAARSRPLGRWTKMALFGILLAATGLRVYGLESGPWLDEVLTDVHYMHLSFGQNITTFDSQNQHFVYSLLAHASAELFGDSIWASRLPAALFGVAGIAALYLLATELTSRREALLASALLTFSYQHIWYSQTARGYSGLLFWSMLASWLLLRALKEHQSRLWVLYAASVALGTYTHMTMLFVVLGHFTIYCVSVARSMRRPVRVSPWPGLVLGFALSAVLVLQLYALVLPQFFSGTLDEQSVVAEWKSPLWTLLEVARSLETSFSGGGVVVIPAVVVVALGVASYVRSDRSLVLIQLLFVPVVLCAAVNLALGHHLWPRFFFFSAGFGVLVAVRGIVVIGEIISQMLGRPRLASPLGTGLCIAAILISARSIPIAYLPKQDYGGALAFIDANRQGGDAVAVAGLAAYPYHELYKVDWQEVETAQELDALRAHSRRTWIVYTLPEVLASVSPDLMGDIQREYTLIQAFPGTLDDGTVFVYRAAGGTAPGAAVQVT
jgi:4-amino-4-deoxy-L-arabinose transferase-like glycosyltransferase